MQKQQTLCLIKPDAVAKNLVGEITTRIEKAGLQVVGAKMVHLSKQEASNFYAVHRERPFYADLVNFISSGPIVALVLEGHGDAVTKYRDLMGATDPKKALAGTLRHDFACSIDENAVHGSDSKENAEKEIAFFFSKDEVFGHQKKGHSGCCC